MHRTAVVHVNRHRSDLDEWHDHADEEFRIDSDPKVIGGRTDKLGTIKEFKKRLNDLVHRRHLHNQVLENHSRAAAEIRWGKLKRNRNWDRQDSEGNP